MLDLGIFKALITWNYQKSLILFLLLQWIKNNFVKYYKDFSKFNLFLFLKQFFFFAEAVFMNNQQVMRKNIEINQAYSIFFFLLKFSVLKWIKLKLKKFFFKIKKWKKQFAWFNFTFSSLISRLFNSSHTFLLVFTLKICITLQFAYKLFFLVFIESND